MVQESTSTKKGSLLSLAICGDRILRINDVKAKTGLCRSHIHNLIASQRFPKPLKLVPGGRASGFLESEVNAWIAERVAERDARAEAAGQAATE